MPVRRLFTQRLIGPEEVPPSRSDFEVVGVFNPGAVKLGDDIVLLVRVAERLRERRAGYTSFPYWDDGELNFNWIPNEELEPLDPRLVRIRATGLVRLTFTSHLFVVRLTADGRAIKDRLDITFQPEHEYEEFGVEDPRMTCIDGRCYITYVAVSRHGPATALASTTDFRTFHRHGIIFCPENKDVVFFPAKLGQHYVALHRPVCGTPFTRPEMWLAYSEDLLHWGKHEPLCFPDTDWQSGRLGAGCPPVHVPEGWLVLYHGNRRPQCPGDVGAYTGGALLLAADNPAHVVRRSIEPLMEPELPFEINGFIPKVVFPTGIIEAGDEYLVYYGAADTCTAVVGFNRSELLAALR